MFKKNLKISNAVLLICSILSINPLPVFSQSSNSDFSFKDLSAFKPVSKNWFVAGDVTFDLNDSKSVKTTKGQGILVNVNTEKERQDIFTVMEHGDAELDLDFMMAKNSNSGIYLQGRYEIQLLDSWGKKSLYFGDVGGIYERWDESKPEGQKGYEGTAPRVNASKAPGLWQNIKITFVAPKFDDKGTKVSNAKIVRIILNDIPIIENIELSGVTRGSAFKEEAPKGPLRIQGDHGIVAFRNFKVKPLTEAPEEKYPGRWGAANPIKVVAAKEPVIIRSFADFKRPEEEKGTRISHAVSVGHPEEVGYTINLKNGSLIQVWKGEFLDATPMWNSRGNGVSRPGGHKIMLNNQPIMARLSAPNAAWPDTLASENDFRSKGYELDKAGIPTFKYSIHNINIEDKFSIENEGRELVRELKMEGANKENLYILIARGKEISSTAGGRYLINDKEYYLELSNVKPEIRTSNNSKELLLPVSGLKNGTLQYKLIW
ncbi:hypothetical protein BH23BAC1_BH23BAC1_18220 [soil metagenome]